MALRDGGGVPTVPQGLLAAGLCLALGACRSAPVELRFGPEPGTVLTKRFEHVSQPAMEAQLLVDGQALPLGDGTSGMEELLPGGRETWVVRDRHGAGGELVRTYVALAGAAGPEGGSWPFGLQGREVRFVPAGDDRVPDASDLADAGLVADLDLAGLLAPAPVRVGDRWRVPVTVLPVRIAEGEGALKATEWMRRFEAIELTCRLIAAEPARARIHVSVDERQEFDDPAELASVMGVPASAPAPGDYEDFALALTFTGEGELVWDRAAAHLESFAWFQVVALDTRFTGTVTWQGEEATFESVSLVTFSLGSTVALLDD